MPRTRKDEAPIAVSAPMIEGRYVELDDYTVSFETFPIASDPTPLFAGLPDDRCQCPHWGYVVHGSFSANYRDGQEETFHAGDAYFLRPGHLTKLGAGAEVVEFSPTKDLQETMAVVGANMEAGVQVR
jgi:hypothetical protein